MIYRIGPVNIDVEDIARYTGNIESAKKLLNDICSYYTTNPYDSYGIEDIVRSYGADKLLEYKPIKELLTGMLFNYVRSSDMEYGF